MMYVVSVPEPSKQALIREAEQLIKAMMGLPTNPERAEFLAGVMRAHMMKEWERGHLAGLSDGFTERFSTMEVPEPDDRMLIPKIQSFVLKLGWGMNPRLIDNLKTLALRVHTEAWQEAWATGYRARIEEEAGNK